MMSEFGNDTEIILSIVIKSPYVSIVLMSSIYVCP